MKEKTYYIILCLILGFAIQAQSLYGGIEIGGKGIKMSVLDVQNTKKGIYNVKDFWTENVGLTTGIAVDGNLSEGDMENAVKIVLRNYKKMLTVYNIANKNIYIVASSGVGMAKNTDVLTTKIKALTNKNLDIISSLLEAKLLLKGCIPPKKLLSSMILDIGGGNTKGGYIKTINGGNIFFPFALNIGTVTLTEQINKTVEQKPLYDFNEAIFNYLPTLRQNFHKMFASVPEFDDKDNIYLSGGAVWAFYTIINGKTAEDNFCEIKYKDILSSKFIIENNFSKIEKSALGNTEIKKVLDTYSQKNLISASNILLTALEGIPNINDKKIFFTKQGQIAWLVSYVVDHSKGTKPIY
jgi:exopolyphosphatase/pppGpp-phosphohydrolase